MTPIGHTLTGLAIGYAVMPRTISPRATVVTLSMFALLANLPDLPLPGWGHERYNVSHSVFVTTLGVAIGGITVTLLLRHTPYLTWPLFIGGALAWYSHLLLDTLYNHGKGLAIFWPFSDGRVALPIPWFSTMTLSSLFGVHNLRVFAIEGMVYGGLLAAVVVGKECIKHRHTPR